MAEPADETTAGRGGMRASRADRERAVELLKAAFVQDRLTRDEMETRVASALVSRTYADLADLTADIPADLSVPVGLSVSAEPALVESGPAERAPTPVRILAKAARRSGLCILIPFALLGVAVLTGTPSLVPLAFFAGVAAVIASSSFLGYGLVDAWQARRTRRHTPLRRGGGTELTGERPSTSDPALPPNRPGQTWSTMRARQTRTYPAGRAAQPVPSAG